jgi:LmbE family N-acetylglucosaminyl deacetylase
MTSNLALRKLGHEAYRVLCLGAHSDDIEIGCGGTLLSLLEGRENVAVRWVVFSGSEERACEARRSAGIFLARAREKEVVVKSYRDGFFPYLGGQIKDEFEALKGEFSPDLVFTHFRDDRHQDHRLLSDLTWNTFRDHLILEYEIPKYDGDLGQPNVFVPLSESVCSTKVRNIIQNFPSQRENQWFDEQTFLAILRLRGMEANSPTRYAEAFYCRKAVLTGLEGLGIREWGLGIRD